MGGRGSRSTATPPSNPMWQAASYVAQQAVAQAQQQNPNQQPANLQTGSNTQTAGQATATLATIANMTDDQLASALIASRNVDMPNFLNDAPDVTQQFVYQVGLNGLPTVMDAAQFQQFMQQNGIPQSRILARSVNPSRTTHGLPITADQIIRSFKFSEFNYIGGKKGGQAYGGGTYFDMTGGRNTGYGGTTMTGVLNPATARVIDYNTLARRVASFQQSHPKTARALGSFGSRGNESVYALMMGYNVISVSNGYHVIIDRSAVVIKD